MGKIYIVRHCQSIANSERRYNSTLEEDQGLSISGFEQAKKVGKFFNGITVAKIYSSPFLRTIQTAKEISKINGAEIEKIQSFKELDCGLWNKHTETEILQKYPDAWKGWHYDPQNNPIPGGESLMGVAVRVLPDFEALAKKHKKENFCIVTHYCVMNVLLGSLVSSLANFRSYDSGNGAIAEIEYENVPRLKRYISHADML